MAHDIDCLSCAFFKAFPHTTAQGVCRRQPPVPLFLGFQENPITKQPQPMIQAHWPAVGKGVYCGEHPFMAGMRAGKIPLLGAASEIPPPMRVHGHGNGAAPPTTETAPLVDDGDAEIVPGPYQKEGIG